MLNDRQKFFPCRQRESIKTKKNLADCEVFLWDKLEIIFYKSKALESVA